MASPRPVYDDGYPFDWQSEWPPPYPTGMPLWKDSWGPQPAMVYYSDSAGNLQLLPGRLIAEATTAFNEGRAPNPFTEADPVITALNLRPTFQQSMPQLFGNIPSWVNPPAPIASRTAFTNVPAAIDVGRLASNPLASVNETINFGDFVNQADPCQYVPTDIGKAACRALQKGITGNTPLSSTPTQAATGCPKGYHPGPTPGSCELDGIAPYIPGDIGRPDVIWTPINGRFGQGASPVAVQATHLACPAGMVLGKDNVCYEHLARTNRKWNPGHKPLLTGGDMNAIRKTKSLEKRWRKVAPAFHKKVVSSGAKLVKRRTK